MMSVFLKFPSRVTTSVVHQKFDYKKVHLLFNFFFIALIEKFTAFQINCTTVRVFMHLIKCSKCVQKNVGNTKDV